MINHTTIEQIQLLCRELAGINSKIRTQTTTRKLRGRPKAGTAAARYAIQDGYANAVRRPVGDILKWMNRVEEILALIVIELEERES